MEKIKTFRKHYQKDGNYKPNKFVDFKLAFFESFLHNNNALELAKSALCSLLLDPNVFNQFSIPVYVYRSDIDFSCNTPSRTETIGRMNDSHVNTDFNINEISDIETLLKSVDEICSFKVEIIGRYMDQLKDIEKYKLVPMCQVNRKTGSVRILKLILTTEDHMKKIEEYNEKDRRI